MLSDVVSKIKWLGHDGFRVESEKAIYFDPFKIETDVKADLIFITHKHFDHCSPADIAKIRTDSTIIVTDKDTASLLGGENLIVCEPGQSFTAGGVSVQTIPAYNIGKQFHPKKEGWLGFVIEIDGVKIYHAGDTDFIPEMKGLKADIAFIPVSSSGKYVMDVNDAIEAVQAIKPKVVIPMHYGSIGDLNSEDMVRFKKALQGKTEVEILEKVCI